MSSPRFAFLGSPQFSVTILQSLVENNWRPALVITEPPKPVGRTHELTATAVHDRAQGLGLTVATPHDRVELLNSLNSLNSLELLVVAAYGRILPKEVLDLPKHGAINVHASLLPKYRGASPIQAALLAGDDVTGITYMRMEPALDTGPIVETVTVPIEPNDTTPTLTQKLAEAAAQSIVPVLESYLTHSSNHSSLTPQNDADASYAPKLTSQDGQITFSGIDPIVLDRKVRALNPWPGVYTDELSRRLKILEGKLKDQHYTITQLQWAGKRPVDGATFARAYPEVLTHLSPSITLGASFTEHLDAASTDPQ